MSKVDMLKEEIREVECQLFECRKGKPEPVASAMASFHERLAYLYRTLEGLYLMDSDRFYHGGVSND